MDSLRLEDILTDRESSDDLLEVPLTQSIFRIFFSIIVFCACLVVFFLVRLVVFQHDFYSSRAQQNITRIKFQPAPRGVVTDRFGGVLVRSESTFKAYIVPHELPPDSASRFAVIQHIARLLNLSASEISLKLQARDWNYSDRLFISDVLSHDALVALTTLALPGVILEPGYRRVHDVPYVFSHVLGYTGLVNKDDLSSNSEFSIDDEIGRAGLESYYDESLRGVHGKQLIIRDSRGEIEDQRTVQLPREGRPLSTFLDKEFQQYAYARLLEALQALDREAGLVVAMNPQNGEVLALVSVPSFNADSVVSYFSKPSNPIFNRVVYGTYNPGSTIKPLHALAALAEGVISPSAVITSPGFIEIPNPFRPSEVSRFVDWRPNGSTDVRMALARSSNVYFYEIGGGFKDQRGLGILKLKEWWKLFQFDQVTHIDLPHEATGFLPDPAWKERLKKQPWRIGDTYNVSIGQGDLLVTPINLLRYISAIANGGRLLKPRIADSIQPEVLADLRPFSKDMLQHVQAGMIAAVQEESGTAHMLSSLPLSVAGKTGSAQVENNRKVNAFFAGYAPALNPQIALLVLIENAREGGLNTVPIAYDLFNWYHTHRLR